MNRERQKVFVVDCESLPLDLRRKLDLIAYGAAKGQGADAGRLVELEFVVAWPDGEPEPQRVGDGLLRERVI
jgi:hypothetical protein